MEDVLNVYERPYDPEYPVVCMDESSKQQIFETRIPQAATPGKPARIDYEYERNGVGHLFMFVEPLGGKRSVQVRDQHTKKEWTECMRDLVEVQYPGSKKITVVMDNLATHTPEAFYEFFPAEVARKLLDKIEIHYTPKHGSWLNIAEIEFAALNRECLNRRIADRQTLLREIAAWQTARNSKKSKVDWQFKTTEARIKLKRLYPVF